VIELSNYPYGVVMTSSGGAGINKSNVLDSVGLYDENMGAPTLGGFYFDANSVFNLIYVGFADQPLQGGPLVQGPGVQANVVINALGSGTRFPYGITIGQDTVDTTLTIAGSNAASNGGSSIFFNNNGVLAGAIGNYSRIIGGAYSNVFTLYAGGDNIAMPSDNLSVHTGAAPTCLLDIGNGTGTQVLKFSGGNTNAADGARISFFNGASAVAHLGNYSSVQGGAYSSVFTILANGSGVTLPVDNLAIHTGAAPTAVLDVGPGTGGQNVQLNGGNTGANDGVRITFNNAGAPVGYIGNYSAINGGGYNNRFTLYGATRGILIPSDKVGIATGSALNSVGGEIGIGDGTGIRRIVMNGGNTATADGTILLFYNNSGRIGGVGNSSSYFNTAYATYGRSTTLAGYDSVIFSSHDLEAGRIVGNPTTQRWLIGTPTDDTATLLQVGGTCRINGNVGFNNTAPIAKPTLTGAWAGNTAGKALATLLASYGLLTDSSTA
jgi:hypothetical protein